MLAAGLLTCTTPAASAQPGLSAFYKALSALQSGARARLTIVQIGDSLTEGDRFSSALRHLLQQRFGNAGRGMMPPGRASEDWYPLGLKLEQHGPWRVSTSNKTDYDRAPYGLSGLVLHATKPGSSISLEAGDDATFDSVDFGYYRQPDGGSFEVYADGRIIGEVDTSGPGYALTHTHLKVPSRARSLKARTTSNRPVDIANWGIYRDEPGIVLTNHGFSRAQINIMDRWNWPMVTAELRALDPSLVLVAFGTNEGYASLARLKPYAETYERQLKALKQALPNASIVAIGPPDANDLPKYCGLSSKEAAQAPCRELNADEAAHYDKLLRSQDQRLCRWHTPAHIAHVRSLQRKIAERLGILFWDWSRVQGGPCGASRWAEQGLDFQDRVHLRDGGGRISAERLIDVLLSGYNGG